MQSESARMTTAHEASYRIQYPNSLQRAVKVIALDKVSAGIVDEVSKQKWNGAAFFTSLSFSAPNDQKLDAWLQDLTGRTLGLVAEVESSDFVVVITAAGEDARAVSVVADACKMHNKTLVGLVVPQDDTDDDHISESLSHLRPYTKMLVVAHGTDYVQAMLTALRA